MKLHRRRFLQAAGVSLALPCFDAWISKRASAGGQEAEVPPGGVSRTVAGRLEIEAIEPLRVLHYIA